MKWWWCWATSFQIVEVTLMRLASVPSSGTALPLQSRPSIRVNVCLYLDRLWQNSRLWLADFWCCFHQQQSVSDVKERNAFLFMFSSDFRGKLRTGEKKKKKKDCDWSNFWAPSLSVSTQQKSRRKKKLHLSLEAALPVIVWCKSTKSQFACAAIFSLPPKRLWTRHLFQRRNAVSFCFLFFWWSRSACQRPTLIFSVALGHRIIYNKSVGKVTQAVKRNSSDGCRSLKQKNQLMLPEWRTKNRKTGRVGHYFINKSI